MVRLISLGVLLVLIIFLGTTFYQVVAPFLLPLFLAGVVTILCRPLHGRILRRFPDRPRLASGLTTSSVLAIILVPLLVGVLVATLQLYSVAREAIGSADWDQQLSRLSRIASDWGLIELSSNATSRIDGLTWATPACFSINRESSADRRLSNAATRNPAKPLVEVDMIPC